MHLYHYFLEDIRVRCSGEVEFCSTADPFMDCLEGGLAVRQVQKVDVVLMGFQHVIDMGTGQSSVLVPMISFLFLYDVMY